MVFENWKKDGLEIKAASDMHVHLRDGNMMELVVPTIREGGVNQVMVMVCPVYYTLPLHGILMANLYNV